MTTRRRNIVTPESIKGLADQVQAMRAALEDRDAPDRPVVSHAARAYLQGAEDALRVAVTESAAASNRLR